VLKQKKKVVALFGEWNTTNIGDKAIGKEAVKYLIRQNFVIRLYTLGSLEYQGEASNEAAISSTIFSASNIFATNKQTERNSQNSLLRGYSKDIKNVLRFIRNGYRARKLRTTLSSCSAIVVGGGALLDDYKLHFPFSLYFVQRLAQSLSLPIFCLGCSSSGNFSVVGKHIIRNFINYASVVSVRDASTQAVISQLNTSNEVSVFGDFALTVSENNRRVKQALSGKRKIGVNVMQFSGKYLVYQPAYEKFITELVKVWQQIHDVEITLFTTGDLDDYNVAIRISTLFSQPVEVFHPKNLDEIQLFYREKDFVTSSRLHSAIMAISEEIPSIAVYVTKKIKNFFTTIGLGDYCYDALTYEVSLLGALVEKELYCNVLNAINLEQIKFSREKVNKEIRHLYHQAY